MFDFQKLKVYQKARVYNTNVVQLLKSNKTDKAIKNQLIRASSSIMFNIAEGTGRFTILDKRNFYIIARSSSFECISIFEYLIDQNNITEQLYQSFYIQLEEISKMLFALIRSNRKK